MVNFSPSDVLDFRDAVIWISSCAALHFMGMMPSFLRVMCTRPM